MALKQVSDPAGEKEALIITGIDMKNIVLQSKDQTPKVAHSVLSTNLKDGVKIKAYVTRMREKRKEKEEPSK